MYSLLFFTNKRKMEFVMCDDFCSFCLFFFKSVNLDGKLDLSNLASSLYKIITINVICNLIFTCL